MTGRDLLVDSQGLEYDPIVVLECIDQALYELTCKEQDVAIEKTMKTVASLRAVAHSWAEAKFRLGGNLPPSYQWLIRDADERVKELAALIGSDPGPVWVDPTGKTLSDLLITKLMALPKVSPYDNCLVRKKVVRPRIRRLNLDFFKRVRRYLEAMQMM